MWSRYSELFFLALGVTKLANGENCLDVDFVQNDKYMEQHVFRKIRSQSLYTCASACIMSSTCLSFGFEKKTRTCVLNSNSSDSADVVDRTGFLFSDIQHWPKSLSGRCAQNKCPNNDRCEVTRVGLARCVSEFQGCGHPPNVRDAHAMYDGHYQGAVATYSSYTCDPDYRACYDTVTSTCQSSGAWESLAGLCGQFRWNNPINDIFSFPCGSSSKFKLKVSLTPTKYTRFGIALQKQADMLFYSEFRLYYLGFRGKIVVNTRIDANWGSEVHANLGMAVGQNYDVEITLQNGVYRLVVDGASIINFPERASGAEPDELFFLYDFSIGMIWFMS
ncbi:uncharacterized protein [Haliotis asinina]|uniref:uncharacterized protein n=1 Tax=Haliotis asinina TaxID=109174 RepID=UPI00353217E6